MPLVTPSLAASAGSHSRIYWTLTPVGLHHDLEEPGIGVEGLGRLHVRVGVKCVVSVVARVGHRLERYVVIGLMNVNVVVRLEEDGDVVLFKELLDRFRPEVRGALRVRRRPCTAGGWRQSLTSRCRLARQIRNTELVSTPPRLVPRMW